MFESSRPIITGDCREIIAENNKNRSYVGGKGLYSVDDLEYYKVNKVPISCPILKPIKWAETIRGMTMELFTEMFDARYPFASSILQLENVVIAGGAIANILNPMSKTTHDIDVFVHTSDPQNMDALWRTASQIITLFGETRVDVKILRGLMQLKIRDGHEIQLILRAFPSISSIIHGFDVPASMVAYDGKQLYFTIAGIFAHAHMTNIVEVSYASTTFEYRLQKYFNRGYALAFMNIVNFQPGEMQLSVMKLHIVSTGPQNVACGDITTPMNPELNSMSDYAAPHFVGGNAEENLYFNFSHICSLVNIEKSYKQFQYYNRFDENHEPIVPDVRDFIPMTKQEIFKSDEDIRMIVQEKFRHISGSREIPNYMRLACNLPHDKFKKCRDMFYSAIEDNPRAFISLPALEARAVEYVIDLWQKMDENISWWITIDPSRQYTASLNPTKITPLEWYTERYFSDQAYPEAESVSTDASDVCLYCNEVMHLFNDLRNVHDEIPNRLLGIKLVCGHSYHFSCRSECLGLKKKLKDGAVISSEDLPANFPQISSCVICTYYFTKISSKKRGPLSAEIAQISVDLSEILV